MERETIKEKTRPEGEAWRERETQTALIAYVFV